MPRTGQYAERSEIFADRANDEAARIGDDVGQAALQIPVAHRRFIPAQRPQLHAVRRGQRAKAGVTAEIDALARIEAEGRCIIAAEHRRAEFGAERIAPRNLLRADQPGAATRRPASPLP